MSCKYYNANLGKRKKEKKRNTITYRKKYLTYKFKYRGFFCLKKTKITTGGIDNILD